MRNFPLHQARILIIDDEAAMVELLRRTLENEGYREIKSTTDPFAALRLFAEFAPDLVILDLLMPGLSGVEVLAELRAIIPSETYLPILVLTAVPAIALRREALSRGASDFVGKPHDAFELLARIENLLETRFLHLQLSAKIGEWRQAEQTLREREEHLRFTLNATDVGEWELDLATGASRRSLRHDQIFGYDRILPEWSREIFLQKHVHPADRGRVGAALEAGLETGLGWEFECRILRLDGEERFIWVKGATLEGAAHAQKPSGVIMDITLRKRIEIELERRAAKVAALALLGRKALAPGPLAEFFDEAVILMAEALGLECSQILELQPGGRSMLLRAGTGWADGLVGQAIVDANRASQAGFTLHTGSLVTVDGLGAETRFRETPFLRQHGIVSGITAVIGHEGRPFGILGAHSRSPRAFTEAHVHFVQAIANLLAATIERSVMEKALCEAKETAERASAAKSEFLSRMSHELRTPLNAIVGFGQLLERVGRDSEDADNVRQILEAGRHLLGLVNEMFDLSDMETAAGLTIESFPVSEVAGEAMAQPLAAECAVTPAANRLAAPLAESASSAIRDPQSEICNPGTLLYIEENLSHLRLITRILARRPSLRFFSAATSPLGLEIARENRPDLILLDLHVLDSEGDQALARLLADPRTSDVPVVVLSADGLPEKREQMLAAGARAFLAKPVVVRTLLGVVDQFIKQRA